MRLIIESFISSKRGVVALQTAILIPVLVAALIQTILGEKEASVSIRITGCLRQRTDVSSRCVLLLTDAQASESIEAGGGI